MGSFVDFGDKSSESGVAGKCEGPHSYRLLKDSSYYTNWKFIREVDKISTK